MEEDKLPADARTNWLEPHTITHRAINRLGHTEAPYIPHGKYGFPVRTVYIRSRSIELLLAFLCADEMIKCN